MIDINKIERSEIEKALKTTLFLVSIWYSVSTFYYIASFVFGWRYEWDEFMYSVVASGIIQAGFFLCLARVIGSYRNDVAATLKQMQWLYILPIAKFFIDFFPTLEAVPDIGKILSFYLLGQESLWEIMDQEVIAQMWVLASRTFLEGLLVPWIGGVGALLVAISFFLISQVYCGYFETKRDKQNLEKELELTV